MKKYLELLKNSNGVKDLLADTIDDLKVLDKTKETEKLRLNALRDSLREELRQIQDDLNKSEERRIKKELSRLMKIFKEYSIDKEHVVIGLIKRAAFMLIQLENYEYDINVNGSVEKFSQGEQVPYDRARPVVQQYSTMNTNYQKIIKQLNDLLPDNKKFDDIKDVVSSLSKPS